jgi:hypothetical protein
MTKQPSKEQLAYWNIFKRAKHGGKPDNKFRRAVYENMEVDEAFKGPGGFEAFLKDVGPAPGPEYLLDREDNEKGYIRGNLRWVTIEVSNRNRRGARMITAFGRTQHVCDWAEEVGLSRRLILRRIDVLGWSSEDALSYQAYMRPNAPY